MFYSQNFLSRKGPLSTVWMAAHLQNRLKKNHYTSTDIPSTVERIMDPAVPLALRTSGYLLLGAVRIYSKKVDYLFQDCNAALTLLAKSFGSIQVSLPEEATRAPFQSITLPETFDLDALAMDYELDWEDNHLKSPEQITLPDQIPVAMDQYVVISFEDRMMDSLHTQVLPDAGIMPMEEAGVIPMEEAGVIPMEEAGVMPMEEAGVMPMEEAGVMPMEEAGIMPMEEAGVMPMEEAGVMPMEETGVIPMEEDITSLVVLGADNHDPITRRQSPTIQDTGGDTCGFGPGEKSPPQATPIETVCDANNDHNLANPPVSPNPEDADANPSISLNRTTNENDHIPEMIDDLDPEGRFASSQQHPPPTPDNSQRGTTDAQPSGENNSLNFVVRESPPIQRPQRRGRRRLPFYDQPIVLSNEHMRRGLRNTRNILRKRKGAPSSNLDAWKLNKSRRKEQIFDQPLLTGHCKDLLDISKSEYVHSKSHLVISEEDHAARIATTLSPTNQSPEEPFTASEIEIEQPLNVVSSPCPIIPTHEVVLGEHRSPDRSHASHRSERMQTPDLAASPSAHGWSGTIQTPVSAASPDVHGMGTIQTPVSAASPDVHGMGTIQTPSFDTHPPYNNSAEADELSFLENDNTPASSQATSGSVNSLSQTTWRVAQHLEELSPITPISEEPAGDLSLNNILEGKKRRVAARMFFEVLVLKTNELIDVQQEEPYGDISLKLNSTLFNVRI